MATAPIATTAPSAAPIDDDLVLSLSDAAWFGTLEQWVGKPLPAISQSLPTKSCMDQPEPQWQFMKHPG